MTSIAEDIKVVYGYLRECNNIISLPNELYKLILMFYHLTFEAIQFSLFHKSKCGFILKNNNKSHSIYENNDILTHGNKWIVANDSVYDGMDCWRVFVR